MPPWRNPAYPNLHRTLGMPFSATSNLSSPFFTQTQLALLPILIAQPLSVPVMKQIHLITAEPFLVLTVTAFLCVASIFGEGDPRGNGGIWGFLVP